MPGKYREPISIEEAMQQIVSRRYLLPAIQRKFTWDSAQIEVLFDSIMRGYPINTFMLWKVTDTKVKTGFRFYQFLESYCEWFAEDNPGFDTKGHGDFHAVIDGQQRLTSLYIGLKGTYAYKLPKKHWPDVQDDRVLPPRCLYLNISAPLKKGGNDAMMTYEFSFLTRQEFEKKQPEKFWYRVGDILDLPEADSPDQVFDIVFTHLEEIGMGANQYARQTLTRLYTAVRSEDLIHYYEETNQAIDHVLDVFLRTNHGGVPLSFSDLLMSIAVANWKEDAREKIDTLVKQVRSSPSMGFSISRDWVLKAALTLTDADVRFKVENFTGPQVGRIEEVWEEIGACILETFQLIRSFGLNDESLRAKNAAIPLAYYLYHQFSNGADRLYKSINRQAFHGEDRRLMRQWLNMSLLRGVFGGQGDGLISGLRKIIKDNLADTCFPLVKIIEHYRGENKDILFDDDFINRLLRTQKDDATCFSILALIMPDVDFTRALEKDHLHPAVAFDSKRLASCAFLSGNDEELEFYGNPDHWNGIVNLHLLDESLNRSKQDQPLAEWLEERRVRLSDLLIPHEAPLEFERFREFFAQRHQFLFEIFKGLGK